MATKLIMGRDSHSIPNSSIPFSDNGHYITMAPSGTATLSVPFNADIAYIQVQSGSTVLVDTNAISYTSDTSFQTGTFDINPVMRDVNDGSDILHFYSIDDAIVKVSFYRK